MKTAFVFLFVLVVITEGRSAKKHWAQLFRHKVHQQSQEIDNQPITVTASPIGQIGQAVYSGVFPVEVDLSSFMNRITERLDGIDSSIASQGERIDGVVSSLETQVSELRESIATATQGRTVCQTGTVGCTSCGGEDPDLSYSHTEVTRDVYFDREFSSVPTVTLGLKDIYMHDPNKSGEGDNYGWSLDAKYVSTSGFTAYIDLKDYDISELQASWVACLNL